MPQPVPRASRLTRALEHLATINYSVPELLAELLRTNNALIVPARDELRAQRREILRALLYETQTPFDGALRAAELLGLSVGDLMLGLLHCTAPEVSAAVDLALPAFLASALGAHSTVVSSFALNATVSRYVEEMLKITRKSAGFHGGVNSVQPADLEDFDLSTVALRLRQDAPLLWDLLSRLTDARGTHPDSSSGGARVPTFLVAPGDLGAHDDAILLNHGEDDEINEEEAVVNVQRAVEDEDPMAVDDPTVVRAPRPKTVKALRRYTALSEMKVVTILGIAQQATNQQCNLIQLYMGAFLRMTHAPDTVVNVLNHIGITVSNQSMDAAVSSLSKAGAKNLLTQGSTKTSQKAFDNVDFKDPVAQPTVYVDKKMQSAISALNISSHPSLTPEHFRFVDIAWQTNEAIRLPRDPSHRRPHKVSYLEVLQLSSTLDSRPPPLPNALPALAVLLNFWVSPSL
ncbi:hypothetical protein EXIGLDRAFT_784576 [Exidia glandulosa HHB12029]|uniref:Uncharacterized protein n=1 Tax=Exidia glandulosa HHB12029 TaxID=1314781 RepID=A0A166MDT1_EXIGL|nr:hypothetical protein EXIGLDRAFT_784576 [Exidia glandulosa HHB12029]